MTTGRINQVCLKCCWGSCTSMRLITDLHVSAAGMQMFTICKSSSSRLLDDHPQNRNLQLDVCGLHRSVLQLEWMQWKPQTFAHKCAASSWCTVPKEFQYPQRSSLINLSCEVGRCTQAFPIGNPTWQQAGRSKEAATQSWSPFVPNLSCEVRAGELQLSNPYWLGADVNAKCTFFEKGAKRYKKSSNWTSKTCFGEFLHLNGLWYAF